MSKVGGVMVLLFGAFLVWLANTGRAKSFWTILTTDAVNSVPGVPAGGSSGPY